MLFIHFLISLFFTYNICSSVIKTKTYLEWRKERETTMHLFFKVLLSCLEIHFAVLLSKLTTTTTTKHAHIIDTHMPTTLVQVFDSSWIHFNFHCHLSLVSLKSFQTTILTVHMDKYKTQWYVISYALFFTILKKRPHWRKVGVPETGQIM